MDEISKGSIQEKETDGFPVLRTNVAGIDLGSESHWVCAPTVDGQGREVQEFGATTPELEKMTAWLKERKVISVAMESTRRILDSAAGGSGEARTGGGTGRCG